MERLDKQTWFQVERWEHAELLWCAKCRQNRRWCGKWWWWRRDCPRSFTRNSQNNVSEFPSIARLRLGIALSRVCTPLLSSGKPRAEAFKLGRVYAQHCVTGPGIQTPPQPTWIGQRIMTSKVDSMQWHAIMSTRTTLKRFEKLRFHTLLSASMKNATKYSSSTFESEQQVTSASQSHGTCLSMDGTLHSACDAWMLLERTKV